MIGLAQGRHLECDLAVQWAYGDTLALGHLARTFELEGIGMGMGIVPSLVAQGNYGLNLRSINLSALPTASTSLHMPTSFMSVIALVPRVGVQISSMAVDRG